MKYPLYLLLLLILAACEPPPSGQQAPVTGISTGNPQADQFVGGLVEGISDLSTEFQELARPSKVQAWVDKLIVKGQPGSNMPQVATMKEGELATYLKQRTVRKSEFTLRGQRYYEPWILIRTKDSIMGWVHEGGIRYMEEDLLSLLSGGQGSSTTQRTRGLDSSNDPAAPAETMDFFILPGQRMGPIKVGTSEEALVRLYGAASVGRSTVRTTGENMEPCTVLMPGTVNELRITWKDESRNRIKAVYLDRPGRWISPMGLRVGMSLSDLTKANKSPLSFYGFNWEYSGTISSYRNGALGKYEKYFYVVLSPRNSQQVASLLSNFQGNQVLSSNKEGIEQLDLVVNRVVVYLD